MKYACAMCGKTVRRRRWVLLNRYGISNGTQRSLVEGQNGKDEYLWDAEDSQATGAMLHLDQCLFAWLEGKLIELDYRANHPE